MTLAVTLLLFAACEEEPPPPPPVPGAIEANGEVVFHVNRDPFGENMFDAISMRLPPNHLEKLTARVELERFIEKLAIGHVLYEQAIEEGLHRDPQIVDGAAMAAREFIAGIHVDRQATAAVTEEMVRTNYEARKVEFGQPQIKSRHILVLREDDALNLLAGLAAGADFAATAREHSLDHGTAEDGGDLGWVQRERMIPEIAEAAFLAPNGALLGPIPSRFGFHLVKVEDHREAIPFEEVKHQITQQLVDEQRRALIKAIRDDLDVELGATLQAAMDAKATRFPHARTKPLAGMPPGSDVKRAMTKGNSDDE